MTEMLAPPRPDKRPSPSSSPPGHGSRLPAIRGPIETLALAWRRLRRMSTALLLLFSLALASILATFIPQAPSVPPTVASWRAGTAGPGASAARLLDAAGAFDVFGSWWFGALTVLLFTSLTGCLLPRYRAFFRVVRRPPAPGRNLERLESRVVLTTALDSDRALAAAGRVLGRRRFRLRRIEAPASPTGTPQLTAERGHWREGGSLLFHTAFYVLLVGIVVGHTLGFAGQVNIAEGDAFTDTPISYDGQTSGRFWDPADHRGFAVTLDDFDVQYHPNGTPADFVSRITLRGQDGGTRESSVRVNKPVAFEGMKLYQVRFGMAPRVVVRSTESGEEIFSAPVYLAEAGANTWSGLAKVSVGGAFIDPGTGDEVELPQMALDISLLPDATLIDGPAGPQPASASPEVRDPRLLANLYLADDLGLERPVPMSELRPDWNDDQIVGSVALAEGQSATVAGGALTVEFAELDLWSGFQVSHAPGRGILLGAGMLLLFGLIPSLYAYRRRFWVTARATEHGSEVVLAGVGLQRAATFDDEFAAVTASLKEELD